MSDVNGNRLDALKKREAALKAAIAVEQVKQQKRREKVQARLASVLGACMLADLGTSPQIRPSIEESLKRNCNPRDVEFLRATGWRV
jgi:hypothetical protein